MKSFLIFTSIFFASFVLKAQDTINRTDAQGKKDGYWIKKDNDGKKIYEGRFIHDVPIGTFKYFYPEGELKLVAVLSDGGKRSRTTAYFRNGKKMAEGNYLEEKKDSTWKFYSEIDETLVSEDFYKEGKKDGISKTFYPDGVVAERSTWKNGVREGSWEQYYTDGKLKLRCAFKNDLKTGPITTWHMSGRIWVNGQYLDGEADGTWTYISDSGEMVKKEYYSKGLLLKTEDFTKK